jgi:saccharopine dehydrogenase-like NADP-dependent oxidoreductase
MGSMRVAILGAGGSTGAQIAGELAALAEVEALVLLDRDGDRARSVAGQAGGGGKATAATVDGADRQALTLVLEEYSLLVNAAAPGLGPAAMDACLVSDCAYFDLGAGPELTADQLALDEAFTRRGLLAVLGCGGPHASPSVAAETLRRYARGELAGVGVLPFERLDDPAGFDPLSQL